MEDEKIQYDLTVRNNKQTIIQFVYGGDGFDSTRIERQMFDIIKNSDKKFADRYKWKKKELMVCLRRDIYDNYSDGARNPILVEEFEKLKKYRKFLRDNRFDEVVYAPVNVFRIVKQIKINFKIDDNSKSDLDISYLISETDKLCKGLKLSYINSKISDEMNEICTQMLRIIIREKLSSKFLIFENRITKVAFQHIIKKIKEMFVKSIAQPGEMVGCISAQSLGEPTTQLCCHRSTGVKMRIKNEYHEPKIGDIIDNYMNKYNKHVIRTHITKDGRLSYILPILDEWDIKVPGLNYDTQKIEWNKVTLMTKNPPNGKLVRIKTKTGRSVIATLSHAFVSRNEFGKPYTVRGDELRKGMVVPIQRKNNIII